MLLKVQKGNKETDEILFYFLIGWNRRGYPRIHFYCRISSSPNMYWIILIKGKPWTSLHSRQFKHSFPLNSWGFHYSQRRKITKLHVEIWPLLYLLYTTMREGEGEGQMSKLQKESYTSTHPMHCFLSYN